MNIGLMKSSIIGLCIIMLTPFIVTGQENGTGVQIEGPSMTFDTAHYELGKVIKGDTREMLYHFTNTGTEDLKIEIVSGCECTTLDWPRLPIKPGKRGTISAIFDSSEKEHSETVDIDVNLENTDPKNGYPMFVRVTYAFELVEN